jgi:small-conductance mechanosensitive channel
VHQVAGSVCKTNNSWCQFVEDVTHNHTLARASDWLIAKPLKIIALIVVALIVRWLAHRVIDRVTRTASDGSVPGLLARGKVPQFFLETPEHIERRRQRAATMASLLKSITSAVIVSIVIFMVIAELGYDIGPLIASAGIIGVALGFGAQSLVRDFLSGIFMILEDQYGVGDSVDLGSAMGTVQAVGLRVTRLRSDDGTIWYVRNGEVLRVGNRSQGGVGPFPSDAPEEPTSQATTDQPSTPKAQNAPSSAPTLSSMRSALAKLSSSRADHVRDEDSEGRQ